MKAFAFITMSFVLLNTISAVRCGTAETLAHRVQVVLGQKITVKMPAKLRTFFFKTLLAITKDGDAEAEKVFLQQHLPLLKGRITKQYKYALQALQGQYGNLVFTQPLAIQNLIIDLHNEILKKVPWWQSKEWWLSDKPILVLLGIVLGAYMGKKTFDNVRTNVAKARVRAQDAQRRADEAERRYQEALGGIGP